MNIRSAVRGDFAAIAEVELSAGELFAGTHMDWAVGDTTSEAALAKAEQAGLLWVSEQEGQVCGFLLAERIDADLHIWELAVRRDQQGRGIGAALIDTAASAALAGGLKFLTLTTDRILPWNAPWYARLGFEMLDADQLSPRLARQLASEQSPDLRCAMQRATGG